MVLECARGSRTEAVTMPSTGESRGTRSASRSNASSPPSGELSGGRGECFFELIDDEHDDAVRH